jgi:small subunit ribosomal protein S9
MADEPQQPEQDETTADQPEADAAPEEQAPEEQAPEEQAAPEEEAAEEPSVEEQPAEEAPAEPEAEAPAEPQAPASAEPEAEAPAEGEQAEKSEKSDLPPGADLDPIALEPEQQNLSAEDKARLEAEAEERARREAEISADGADEEPAAAPAPARMEAGSRYQATGKRKSSIARVTLVPGKGEIVINQRTIEEYFPRPLHQTMARQALSATGYESLVDVRVRVHGGGISGQASAVRHGIARALTTVDPELRGDLKRRGYLTRDARVKERRKAGLKKARKRPQFSKR